MLQGYLTKTLRLKQLRHSDENSAAMLRTETSFGSSPTIFQHLNGLVIDSKSIRAEQCL